MSCCVLEHDVVMKCFRKILFPEGTWVGMLLPYSSFSLFSIFSILF